MINGADISKTWYYLKKNGIRNTFYAVWERINQKSAPQWCFVPISKEEREVQKQTAFETAVRFSILVPMYETDETFAKEMITSVLTQTYGSFELILADASKSDGVERTVRSFCDERIVYLRLKENNGISENTNRALEAATGDYIALLDHDDLLTENALYEMAGAIEAGRKNGISYGFLYSDEDKCDREGKNFYDPNIKPEFNYDLILSNNYICHLLVMKAELMKQLGFRKEYDGAQDYDLVLRGVTQIAKRAYGYSDGQPPENMKGDGQQILRFQEALGQIGHINKVLYHWRCHEASTAANPQSKRYAYEAGKRALQDFLHTGNIDAEVTDTKHNGFYRIEYKISRENPAGFFEKRPEVGILAGPVIQHNKIAGGIYDDAGICPYQGLNSRFSGYLHRAVLQQDARMIDVRNMAVNPAIQEEMTELMQKYNKEKKSNQDLIYINRQISTHVREKGYLLLWDPFFQREKSVREEEL